MSELTDREERPVDVLTFGETMASLSSREATPLRFASTLRLRIGGAESNLAIAAHRLGLRTRWIGRVGDDEFGALVTDTIRGQGVSVHAVIDGERRTGLMVKSVRRAGRPAVAYYRSGSAGAALRPQDVPTQEIEGARALHISGITPALSDSAGDAVRTAVEVARARRVIASVDLNYRRGLWDPAEAQPWLRWLAERADVLFATDDEMAIAFPGTDPLAAARAVADSGAVVLLKRGAQGALRITSSAVTPVAPVPVDEVDPVGAGDAFAAGYLAGMLQAPGQATAWAAVAGAWAASTEGDWEGTPLMAELLDSLRHQQAENVAR